MVIGGEARKRRKNVVLKYKLEQNKERDQVCSGQALQLAWKQNATKKKTPGCRRDLNEAKYTGISFGITRERVNHHRNKPGCPHLGPDNKKRRNDLANNTLQAHPRVHKNRKARTWVRISKSGGTTLEIILCKNSFPSPQVHESTHLGPPMVRKLPQSPFITKLT